MKIYSKRSGFNADLHTPVEIYLRVRNSYRKTCLMESNDFHSREDSKSLIGLDPLIELTQEHNELTVKTVSERISRMISEKKVSTTVQELLNGFQFEDQTEFNGFFGRIGYEITGAEETGESTSQSTRLPLLHLFLYRFVIVLDHFTNEGYLIENSFDYSFTNKKLEQILDAHTGTQIPFELLGKENAQYSDDEFLEMVNTSIEHCKRGDVFQLVISNEFQQQYYGDDFEVYRALRRTSPSPYLFYFDFESYRLFGSSPEAQLVVNKGKCEIHPIAGTVPKTGVEQTDNLQLDFLISDEKENAEHTMLVDLARNDLSRLCSNVQVERFKQVQHFSHVIHLVSKVTGELNETNNFSTLCSTFPAGTLSGTPKPKALELIHKMESNSRDYYGGAIGMITPNNALNMCIVIRSVMSINNTLHYRAGAGVVIDSTPEREVQEVHHKLNSVRKAINKAITENQTSKHSSHAYHSH
jgi:anthranilate synthase component 1